MRKIKAAIENSILAYNNNKKIKTSNIKLNKLIISPGGVGTTFLIDHISNYTSVNKANDIDNLKHLIDITIDDDTKVIFIHGNIDDIYKSINRRGWLKKQTSKLGCIFCSFIPNKYLESIFKKKIEKQIKNFKNKKNVLNIEYDEIWDNKQLIKDYFKIESKEFIQNFPERKKRTKN